MAPLTHLPAARGAVIAADVGGTHARLALARRDSAGSVVLSDSQTFACAEHESLTAIIGYFAAQFPAREIAGVSIACAGFAIDGRIARNNLPWDVDVRDIARELGLHIVLLNDFEAVGYATLYVAPADVTPVISIGPRGSNPSNAPQAVLGPGTGLGAAIVVPLASGAIVVATEAGHAGFAPASALELRILEVMQETAPHVANEHLISGPGLLNLYRALARIRNREASLATPVAISDAALSGADELAHQALSVFCGALGSLAGDLVLAQGAHGGVHLAGGILPRIKPFLLASDFAQRFVDKGVRRPLLERVPVRLIDHGQLGVLGAAHWYFDRETRGLQA